MIVSINVTPSSMLAIQIHVRRAVIYQAAIKVDLLKVSGENTEHITLRLTVMKDGAYMLDKSPVTNERITQIVADSIKADPTASAVVAADRDSRHGQVIGLIDLLKMNGMTKIALGVDSSEEKKAGK